MIKKYRMLGGNLGGKGMQVTFASKETALDKIPDPRLVNHVQLPPDTSRDIITMGAKYVESRENLNRAWFANSELVTAYNTIPYKALDVEHDVEKVVGHIYSSMYVDRANNNILDPTELAKMKPEDLDKIMIDVIVGGVVYIDRFPELESPVSTKAYKLSMETYFDEFDIMLENGTRLTLEEADLYGLGEFIDQLMGSFESVEDFNLAHSLMVITADNKKAPMKIYKYLKGLLFSGGGLVLNPACPSCHILTTSCDVCDDVKEAASMKTDEGSTQFSIDLRKVDSYMEKIRDKGGKPTVHRVDEDLENKAQAEDVPMVPTAPTDPTPPANESVTTPTPIDLRVGDPPRPTAPPTDFPPSSHSPTPIDQSANPAPCPNYMLDQDMACLFADKQCEVGGNRTNKSCYRWFKDEQGAWKFDGRNHVDDDEEIVINDNMEPVVIIDENNPVSAAMKRKKMDWMATKVEEMENFLEAFHLEREEILAKYEHAAAWSTEMINNLPNGSFAVVEKGYKAGESPKSARHLPYKDGGGKVDLPHLRNALARMSQIKSVLGTEGDSELRARAKAKLSPLAKKHFPNTTTED